MLPSSAPLKVAANRSKFGRKTPMTVALSSASRRQTAPSRQLPQVDRPSIDPSKCGKSAQKSPSPAPKLNADANRVRNFKARAIPAGQRAANAVRIEKGHVDGFGSGRAAEPIGASAAPSAARLCRLGARGARMAGSDRREKRAGHSPLPFRSKSL